MKDLFKITLLILILSCLSCNKTDHGTSSKLELLQHKWAIVSLNGEALRYIGTAQDYYDFSSNNFLYRYVAGKFDTSYYQFSLASDDTLLLYPVTNGVKSNSPIEYYIKNLSATQLVLSTGTMNPPVNVIDSLRR